MKRVSSRDNPVFKHLRLLARDAGYRREQSATIADGDHLVGAALDCSWPVTRLVTRSGESKPALHVVVERARSRGIELIELAPALFDQVSPVATPSGVLAEIGIKAGSNPAGMQGDILALAGVQDAGNLGSLLRSAAAAGIQAAWCDSLCAHAWSPKALRAGMGAQFHIQVIEGCDLAGLIANSLQRVLVTCLDGATESLYQLDLRQPSIWIFGSEGQGVPVTLRDLADIQVRIPMPGDIESLNVGAAAAICFFEQVRQRQIG